MEEGEKRLFFGVEVEAPWPSKLPPGRFLDEAHRHLTLAFLGNTSFPKLLALLHDFPKPAYRIGPVGHFDEQLFLTKRHPNVVAWHIAWHRDHPLEAFQTALSGWLIENGYEVDSRPWLPHVTLCRQPFDPKKWSRCFQRIPLISGSIHLYESCGQLTYKPVWSYPIQRPFVEIEHTADMAFQIYGETMAQVYDNACAALAFKCPALLEYIDYRFEPVSLEDVVRALNALICTADGIVGCPMKAVSYHGDAVQSDNGLYCWEMIVDV
jgi:RNA 2',3'-cyclic 3'-phosphodiesterase